MHCQSCVGKVKSALSALPGVTAVDVTLNPPEATVSMSQHVMTETLNDAVKPIGNYTLSEKVGSPIASASTMPDGAPQSLRLLFVIVGYITGGVLLRAYIAGDYSLHSLMSNFMGGFFVLFSLFKMIDLYGFAEGYSTYDVIAKQSRAYALTYPFLELALGVAYFTGVFPTVTNLVTLVLMAVGTIGVAKALMEKRTIQCACLGTSLKLPMTKVTLAEDVVMGVMAALMLTILR